MSCAKKPNIILVYVDDMGCGDLSCLNPNAKVSTPNLDRIAGEGMAFTDAHASSAMCTPSRYALMTGRYNWRSALKKEVLREAQPHLIETGRMTLASMLKGQGYRTACVGKWHLGMDWVKTGPETFDIDYTQPLTNGPCACGFDYFYGMESSLDSGPYTYIENNMVVTLPDAGYTGYEPFPHMGKGGMEGWSYGPIAPNFKHEDVVPDFNRKVIDLVNGYSKEEQPFFIYYPTPAVHIPLVPTGEFRGRSGIGLYGDFILELDACMGDLMQCLEENGIADNTILVFATDNGCSPAVDFDALAAFGHDPSNGYRGWKGDIYDGGHRCPCLVRWPERITPGTTCTSTICFTDFLATFADMLGYEIPDNAGEDSVSMLPLWDGGTMQIRQDVLHSSLNGSFAIRSGKWKLALCPCSGGVLWNAGIEKAAEGVQFQLFDMEADPGEKNNLVAEYPELVTELRARVADYILRGRSTPGAPQENTVPRWEEMLWVYDLPQKA